MAGFKENEVVPGNLQALDHLRLGSFPFHRRRPTTSNVDPIKTLPSPPDLVSGGGGGGDEACDWEQQRRRHQGLRLVVTSWATEAKKLPSSGSIGGREMGTSEMVGFERIWGESRTRTEGGAAPLPMFCERRNGGCWSTHSAHLPRKNPHTGGDWRTTRDSLTYHQSLL
jgi:hypothetical protein